MVNYSDLIERFSKIEWLANVGQPEENAQVLGSLQEIIEKIDEEPDSFFGPPYTDPYEAMCVEDHKAAARIDASSRDTRPNAIAKKAYLSAWDCLPNPELCGLVSDDAQTIMALLLSGEAVRQFTLERMGWYEKGRVPWGYTGDFPNGRWLIL